jgi:hypothetical protein
MKKTHLKEHAMSEEKKKSPSLFASAKALLAKGLGREEKLEESPSTQALRAAPAAKPKPKSQVTRKIVTTGRVQAPRHDTPRGKASKKG